MTIQEGFTAVKGKCPSCGLSSLFLGKGGWVTCSSLDCKNPTAGSDALKEPPASDERAILVKVKATPSGLRNIADMLEELGEGKSIRINWYTSQIEFVYGGENADTIIQG